VLFTVASCNAPQPSAAPSATSPRPTQTEAPTEPAPGPTSMPPGEAADLIFHNGPILTMVQSAPTADALAVRGEEILAVGDEADVMAWRGEGTQVVDLGGRTLMPGFVDSHNHIMNYYNSELYGDTLAERQRVLLSNGITTHANLHTSEDLLAALQDFDESGQLVVRMGAFLLYNDSCGTPQGDWYLDHPPTRARGEHLRIQGVKVFADGANCGITPAFTVKLAPDTPVPLEPPFVTEDELTDVMVEAQALGDQVAVHTIGDRALDLVQAAFARALDGRPNTYRHRIEHNSVVRPDQIPVYSEIDAVLTIFALYPSCNPFGPPIYPEYQAWEWPYNEIIDANPDLHIAWSGDAASFSENPLYQLFGFVTSYDVGQDGTPCEPRPYLADRSMPVEEALYRMTMESAYSLFREGEVGSLEPGKYADLIVLSDDPTTIDPFAIKDITVRMTMIGGDMLYCADGIEAVCP
ncbi:MAG: amidohydrolase family protein, partial [Anaerolineales bacterium]